MTEDERNELQKAMAALKEVLNSDMAMRETDEGRESKELQILVQSLAILDKMLEDKC